MIDVDKSMRFSEQQVWVLVEGGVAVIGITEHAHEQLGTADSVELPSVGERLEQNRLFGSIEGAARSFDLIAPIDGVVVAINPKVEASPHSLSDDPFGEGWLLKVRPDDWSQVDELRSLDDYEASPW